jgi:hypothetical protein
MIPEFKSQPEANEAFRKLIETVALMDLDGTLL